MKTKTLVATLFAVAQLLFISVTTHAQTANYIMKNDGSGNPVNTSKLFEYNDNYIGIGTTTPIARLHITQPTITPMPPYFSITQPGFTPPVTFSNIPIFTVSGNANVGIGTATPQTMLHVQSRKAIAAFNDDPFSQKLFYMTNKNGNDLVMISDMSYNDGADVSAAFLGVLGANRNDMLAFAVFTPTELLFPFSVLGDGTVALGIDLNYSTDPYAQLDIRKHNSYDYIMSVADANNATKHFNVANSGNVGIGMASNTAPGALSVYKNGSATYLDIYSSYDGAALRFMGSTSAQHSISQAAGGDLLIDAGLAGGGGNDKLKIDGSVAVTRAAGTVYMDLIETSSTVDHNAQIRFIGSDGTTVRHLITEDASGNLLINAGYAGGSDKVVINGNTTTTGGIDMTQGDPGSNGWYNQIQFHNGTGTTKQVLANLGNDLILNLNPYGAGSGVLKVSGKVQIGDVSTPGSYKLYVQDGILAERFKCALKSDNTNWSDYVFDKNYKLMSLNKLEEYVKKHHHLPNIPSAEEVYRDGIDLGDMDAKLLEKIEELTLYIIDLQDQVQKLKKCQN